MPRYKVNLPVRATRGYRLPDNVFEANNLSVTSHGTSISSLTVLEIETNDAKSAYVSAQQTANKFLGHLALLGEDAAFVLDGIEGVSVKNLDIAENQNAVNAACPPIESIGGQLFQAVADSIDPSESIRRSGSVIVLNSSVSQVFTRPKLDTLFDLYNHNESVSNRVNQAIDLVHSAACSENQTSAFLQAYTALEVLTSHKSIPSVLDNVYPENPDLNDERNLNYRTKKAFTKGLKDFLANAGLLPDESERIANYSATANSISKIDVFLEYFSEFDTEEINVTRDEIKEWNKIRGAAVHAAEADDANLETMSRFRHVIRSAILEELKRAAPDA